MADIDAAQARAAGYPTADELLAGLRGDQEMALYRIRLRRLDEPDPRDVLAASASPSQDELAALGIRLARMDASSARGPWTTAVLEWIAERPATSSAVLADALSWARPDLKLRIRKLKELGLTISLDTGYRLSPPAATPTSARCGPAAGTIPDLSSGAPPRPGSGEPRPWVLEPDLKITQWSLSLPPGPGRPARPYAAKS